MSQLLDGVGDLVTADTDEAEALHAALLLFLPVRCRGPLCIVKGFKEEKNYQQWIRIYSGIVGENLIHTRPWDQMGCIQKC